MTKPYLPLSATAQEAADWLQAETGEPWPLPRLFDSGVMPHVWLMPSGEESPAVLSAVFDDRDTGFLAPLMLADDMKRLSVDRTCAMSMTRTRTGSWLSISPPNPIPIDELRYDAKDIRYLAATASDDKQAGNGAAGPMPGNPAVGAANDWKQVARDEARRIRKDRKGLGWTPNLVILSEEVATLFLARGINGPNGLALTGAYIKRWALQGHGITNDADRLRSTLNARGK